jgi:hypothetical protein
MVIKLVKMIIRLRRSACVLLQGMAEVGGMGAENEQRKRQAEAGNDKAVRMHEMAAL